MFLITQGPFPNNNGAYFHKTAGTYYNIRNSSVWGKESVHALLQHDQR